jgi:DNA mismatch repair protein MutS
VSEDLLNRVRCRTLFATHYHELSLLSHPRLANRSMEVLDQDGEIVFLRRLKEGPAAESYGLHVARLAGLSEPVLDRAAQILEGVRLRMTAGGKPSETETAAAPPAPAANPPDRRAEQLLAEIASLDPDNVTPLEALNRITIWKKKFSPPPGPGKIVSPQKPKQIEAQLPSLFDE